MAIFYYTFMQIYLVYIHICLQLERNFHRNLIVLAGHLYFLQSISTELVTCGDKYPPGRLTRAMKMTYNGNIDYHVYL